MTKIDAKIPDGNLAEKWTKFKSSVPLVNPSNKRNLEIIVIGSGLAGSSAAASLAELGYKVKVFCFQDSPRRAHSIAAQGGINAAKNYQNDGDSVYRLFYDTIKGGDYRSREANVDLCGPLLGLVGTHRFREESGRHRYSGRDYYLDRNLQLAPPRNLSAEAPDPRRK